MMTVMSNSKWSMIREGRRQLRLEEVQLEAEEPSRGGKGGEGDIKLGNTL